jgi:hypothetical protein
MLATLPSPGLRRTWGGSTRRRIPGLLYLLEGRGARDTAVLALGVQDGTEEHQGLCPEARRRAAEALCRSGGNKSTIVYLRRRLPHRATSVDWMVESTGWPTSLEYVGIMSRLGIQPRGGDLGGRAPSAFGWAGCCHSYRRGGKGGKIPTAQSAETGGQLHAHVVNTGQSRKAAGGGDTHPKARSSRLHKDPRKALKRSLS